MWVDTDYKAIPHVDATQRVDLPGCYYRDSDFCFLDDMMGAFDLPSLEDLASLSSRG